MRHIELNSYNNACYFTIYATSADSKYEYFSWDNVHFKTLDVAIEHLKKIKQENPTWKDRFVIIKTRHYLQDIKEYET